MNPIGRLRNMTSVYLTHDDRILLLFRQGSRVVNDKWIGSAGGHFEPRELNDAYACAMRELKEELGITPDMLEKIELRYLTIYNKLEELRQNYYFFAQLKDDSVIKTSNEGQLKWFDIEEIVSLDMPFTSKMVTNHWVKEGRHTNCFYGGVATDNDMVFLEMKEF
ncbi:MAG: NUDIX domain-containing protein [Oscillospiraceae bacterium]|nr:NUDIX domain-containing protein [Oscillospiraceae bacterium]